MMHSGAQLGKTVFHACLGVSRVEGVQREGREGEEKRSPGGGTQREGRAAPEPHLRWLPRD